MGYSASSYNNMGNLYLTVNNESCYKSLIKLEQTTAKPSTSIYYTESSTTFTYAPLNGFSSISSINGQVLVFLTLSLIVSVF